ncbi:hypothetical protein [Massilia brevitalea]|uniref:hypothetical protein n=1 Tax=Massilia brevitalea TaxID=442526 RepID=UPI002738AD8F|nr:hypothetical protein [Massilia brevitalea]
MPSSGGPTRYIVRAANDDGALASFIASIHNDPAVRLVDTIGPSAGPPHTVVVETDPATAEQLKQRTRNQLMIEPDSPLSLF